MANKRFGLGMLVMVVVLGMAVGGCDNSNNPTNIGDPTYDSVTINIPAINAITLRGVAGTNVIFGGNGAMFTATVNGSNDPVQTVTWTINGDALKAGTTINADTGLLSVAADEIHGKEVTITATSAIADNVTAYIMVVLVQFLPSDFFGVWSAERGSVTISADELAYEGSVYYRLENLRWTPKVNNENEVGYAFAGILAERTGVWGPHNIDGNEANIGEIALDWWFINSDKNILSWGEWDQQGRYSLDDEFLKQ